MVTIICVLQTSTFFNSASNSTLEYKEKQVRWLKKQVEKQCAAPHRFVCLTDLNKIDGVETIKLKHNWPGWWSKIELFRPDLDYSQAFYLDLDTVLVNDIAHIVDREHKFTVLRNLSELRLASHPSRCKRIGSGIMAWRKGRVEYLYNEFKISPDKYMGEYVTSKRWGDQGFIQEIGGPFDYFQDMFPKQIVSSKHGLKNKKPPKEAKIVCFHGSPKPWEIKEDWVPEMED